MTQEESKEKSKSYFEAINEENFNRLIAVGFTEGQARVLLDIIQSKALSGGLF